MTKFNHADKVTCMITRDGTVHNITDARISIDDDGTPFICHNNPDCEGTLAGDRLGYISSWQLSKNFTNDFVTNLKLAVRSVRDADVGDIVTEGGGNTRMVIDSFPNSVLLSYVYDHRKASSHYSRYQLERSFTFVEPTLTPPPEEMTLAEVCKALGKDIIIKN